VTGKSVAGRLYFEFMLAILSVSLFSFFTNIPLGIWKERYKRFSLRWMIIIHLSVPAIIALRIYLEANRYFVPLYIAMAVAGQFVGKRLPYL
jgi:cobalamin synthase